MTEWLHFIFSPSCIGEGNGNPLQCSCLENPRAGEAWWAAVYGVAQSRTWLKWLSSSSSRKWSQVMRLPTVEPQVVLGLVLASQCVELGPVVVGCGAGGPGSSSHLFMDRAISWPADCGIWSFPKLVSSHCDWGWTPGQLVEGFKVPCVTLLAVVSAF